MTAAMPDAVKKEDYEEPRCPLDMHPEVDPIPLRRMTEKLDAYLAKNDFAGAERHLEYWRKEAQSGNDLRGELAVLNEMIGLFRKTEKEAACLSAIADALSLSERAGMKETVTYGTTLINAATGYKSFGKTADALPLYREAAKIYETCLDAADGRRGGLYNNMALTLAELGFYAEAKDLYGKAIGVMEKQENGALEVAVTHLNLADLAAAEKGLEEGAEEIEMHVKKAEDLLLSDAFTNNGHTAFIFEKCAPVFSYYGHFFTENELGRRIKEIRERT